MHKSFHVCSHRTGAQPAWCSKWLDDMLVHESNDYDDESVGRQLSRTLRSNSTAPYHAPQFNVTMPAGALKNKYQWVQPLDHPNTYHQKTGVYVICVLVTMTFLISLLVQMEDNWQSLWSLTHLPCIYQDKIISTSHIQICIYSMINNAKKNTDWSIFLL